MKASDNPFARVIHVLRTANPTTPTDSSWNVYAKADGIYAQSSNAVVGPFGAAGGSFSFGSNSMAVGATNQAGTSGTYVGSDHRHFGLHSITSSSSNTLWRPTVNFRSGANIGITASDSDGDGNLDTITISGGAGSGGGGLTSPWGTAVITQSGSSFTGWTNDSGTWSSNGTEFTANPGTGNTAKARYTTTVLKMPCRIDFEVFFDSTGTSEASGSFCAMGLGSSSAPSKGPLGGLRMVSNNPAANGQAYFEEQGQTGFNGTTSTFALDTWVSLRVDISSALSVTLTKSGTVVDAAAWTPNGASAVHQISLLMVAFEAKVKVRNISVYQLT